MKLETAGSMHHGRDQLHRFLRAAHRRWVAWRAFEQMGICVLVGSALAVPLIAVLWFAGQSALPLVMTIIVGSAVVGLFVGFVRRPSLLDTAMEADRQLQLHDLLGSALALPECRYLDDAWRATIQQLAEARCAQISPFQLVLRRLGSRTWGGIGLSAALVLTLGLMTTTPLSTSARTGSQPRTIALTVENSTAATASPADRVNLARQGRSDSARPSQRSDEAGGFVDAANDGSVDARAVNEENAHSTPGGDGHGTAAAQTKPPTHVSTQLSQLDPADSSDATGSPDADTAGGGRSDRSNASGPADASATGSTQSIPQRSVPPWRSSTWGRERAAAMQAIRSGQVPDRYRDLVREYFDPERD